MRVHTKVPFQNYPSRIGPLSTFKGQQSSQSILNFNHGLVEDLNPSSSSSSFELIAAIKEDDAWVKINLNKKYLFEGWFDLPIFTYFEKSSIWVNLLRCSIIKYQALLSAGIHNRRQFNFLDRTQFVKRLRFIEAYVRLLHGRYLPQGELYRTSMTNYWKIQRFYTIPFLRWKMPIWILKVSH